LGGCYRSHGLPEDATPPSDAGFDVILDGTPDALPDATDTDTCEDAGPVEPGVELRVDMLFVIDSSGSMSEEQEALAREFPRMVGMLVTGDLNEDGRPEFEPVTDLRVGVITTELTTGDIELPGCSLDTLDGDDGVLRTHGYWWRRECARHYPRFLSFLPSDGRADRFVADFSCVAQVGNEGCGFEQPLEATLKALTPSTSEIRFLDGTGRGDLDNAGFIRDDAVLAVVVVTDEDDCSVADRELYDLESERYPMVGNLRCFHHPEATTPTERYVEGFRLFKEDPNDFFFAAITGVPPDLVEDATEIDFDALRADPRMVRRPERTRAGERLAPACDVEGIGFAEPALRLVDVVEGLGENATIRSICDESFTEALGGLTSQLGRVIRRHRCR
jgi:hypothetical protein